MCDELVKRLREAPYDWPDADLHYEAADAIEELVRRNEQFMYTPLPAWVPVTERLPKEDESVLVVRKFLGLKGQVRPSTYVEIAYRIGDRWVADSDEYKIARSRHTDPLYWMPLPKPPKGEDDVSGQT